MTNGLLKVPTMSQRLSWHTYKSSLSEEYMTNGLLRVPTMSQRLSWHTYSLVITGTEEELHLSLIFSILGDHD